MLNIFFYFLIKLKQKRSYKKKQLKTTIRRAHQLTCFKKNQREEKEEKK